MVQDDATLEDLSYTLEAYLGLYAEQS